MHRTYTTSQGSMACKVSQISCKISIVSKEIEVLVNNIKLKSLKMGKIYISFNSGLNYILGRNASGKTTIFNAIRYAIGLDKSFSHNSFSSIELVILVNEREIRFTREVGSLLIRTTEKDLIQEIKAQTLEWDKYLKALLSFEYIYQSNSESALPILDFCFLSEMKTTNRRKQWETVNSICGINTSMFRVVENDILALRKEVDQNKKYKAVIEEFSNKLVTNLNNNNQLSNSINSVGEIKEEFFNSYDEKEKLLLNAILKFDEIKDTSNKELAIKLSEIESTFLNLNNHTGFHKEEFEGLENFIKEKSTFMSFGAETYSRFLIILSIAIVSQGGSLNFPNFIVSDGYLSSNDNFTYSNAITLLERLTTNNKNLQYIEFTNRQDVPSEHVVLDLYAQGDIHGC
ncbi:ATP-binding protein [Thalassotalea sp. 1_MG-2023]|uniref:AAA family ATPase n=1 Tax=Thalassotalea sp. 1_MG-2023 TaxID=3062680 RepID=UPI0026E12EF6|nr:ATP-binding protein [Thalassotalea sp. 1_MG-2023]MDO6428153.1 ATP-binding protein [Thalassotalea sp. 1_MG-2023]